MRHELIAKEDVDDRYGDRHFVVKEGETIEVSAKGVEVAISTGKFDYVKEIPETEIEKKRADEAKKAEQKVHAQAVAEKVKSLMKSNNKEQLVDLAEKLKLEGVSGLDKEALAKVIAEAQVGGKK